jgi:hypothetical protein
MTHETLTVITRLLPATADAVRTELMALQTALQEGRLPFLKELPGLFFARWSLLPRELLVRGDGGSSAMGDCLAFGADFTSTEETQDPCGRFLAHLIEALGRDAEGRRLFEAVYRHCAGYPAAGLERPEEVLAFLRDEAHLIPFSARHVEFPYRHETPESIGEALTLRATVDTLLNDTRGPLRRELQSRAGSGRRPWGLGARGALVTRAFELLRQHGAVRALLADEETQRRLQRARRRSLWKSGVYPPLRTVVRLGVAVCQGVQRVQQGYWRAVHRLSNLSEPPPRGAEPPPVVERHVQNPLVLVSEVTGGALGRAAIGLVLRSLNVRLERYLVGINDIKSIHCARWLLYRTGAGGRRRHYLVFFSNYDGSWESYIDAFVEHQDVRDVLALIWSQTEGFPTPRKGRPFVRPFKAWIHSTTAPVLVWYSAFAHKLGLPEVATVDVQGALRLRTLLSRASLHRPLRDYPARRALGEFLAKGTCEPERLPLYVATEPVRLVVDVLRDVRAELLIRWRQLREHTRPVRSLPGHAGPAPAVAARAQASHARGDARGRAGAGGARLWHHVGRWLPLRDHP